MGENHHRGLNTATVTKASDRKMRGHPVRSGRSGLEGEIGDVVDLHSVWVVWVLIIQH